MSIDALLNPSIPPTFLQHAAEILADTNLGLSGPNIVKLTAAYAVEYDVSIPHPTYPFGPINKRTALFDNLSAFTPAQQYLIIRELCDHPSFGLKAGDARHDLKVKLAKRYSHLAPSLSATEVNGQLVEETRHWLEKHPEALSLYNDALHKLEHGIFHRNLLDDLRLALEKLLRGVLSNDKSLENQISFLGTYISDRAGSKELANMFVKLIDYYGKYQNTYVKHDDAVIEPEIEIIFEITSSFMKHLVRLGEL